MKMKHILSSILMIIALAGCPPPTEPSPFAPPVAFAHVWAGATFKIPGCDELFTKINWDTHGEPNATYIDESGAERQVTFEGGATCFVVQDVLAWPPPPPGPMMPSDEAPPVY